MEFGNHSIADREAPTVRYSNRRPFREQVRFLRRQFLQDGALPFTDVLTEEVIARALTALSGWLDRIFSPLVTLWVFLGQVLSSSFAQFRTVREPRRPIFGSGLHHGLPLLAWINAATGLVNPSG